MRLGASYTRRGAVGVVCSCIEGAGPRIGCCVGRGADSGDKQAGTVLLFAVC